ncbi:MAG: arsenosugar biosynthesis radical SAM (seleno)protein ArsS [Myxococcota bacterium]
MTLTLLRREHSLAAPSAQRAHLAAIPLARTFEEAVSASPLGELRRARTQILQLNVGKRCNQTCRHCHVDAGPDRKEVMPDDVVDRVLTLIDTYHFDLIDITGGAPELHPRFREIVRRARARGVRVMDRCNLTILMTKAHDDLAAFLAQHHVEVTASLPHPSARSTDAQRGEGVFESSIEALRRLNALGYGREGSGLDLTLVTNPVGAFLPAHQAEAERDFRQRLGGRYGVVFNRLICITNMPISRYLEWLEESGNTARYLEALVNAFNPAALPGVMCRNTLSVGYDGRLFDCDFNQMLDLPIEQTPSRPRTIFDVDVDALAGGAIRVGPHCYGCTAGQGSSCGGATSP